MKSHGVVLRKRSAVFALGALLFSAIVPARASVEAPEGDAPTISWSTTDSGGGTSAGGNFSVQGTIAQVDADPLQPSSGGPFEVSGGFWVIAVTPPADPMFRDGFE